MNQKLSVITKSKTRVDHYYETNGYCLIHNTENDHITLVFGNDGLCGITDLSAGLLQIGWDPTQPIKIENIKWI